MKCSEKTLSGKQCLLEAVWGKLCTPHWMHSNKLWEKRRDVKKK